MENNLKIVILSKRHTSLETKVKSVLKEIEMYCNSVFEARIYFNASIKEVHSGNSIVAAYIYKILEVNHRFFEVWHYRPDGSQDYMVASVEEVNNG